MRRYLFVLSIALSFLTQAQDTKLTLERIFSTGEFRGDWFGQLRWFDGGDAYVTLEPSSEYPGYLDLVRNIPGGKRSVLIRAADLIPSGSSNPILVEDYNWSADKSKVLIYTNSKRVWRENTRGDYWVLDLNAKSLNKLGGQEANPSTLMFAKFSPDGSKVGYVRESNVYVESLSDKSIVALTNDGDGDIINGTFDWAYEEEFGCQDGFIWSPDGTKIAYWQIDASTIRDFYMINTTDSIYSYLIPIQYPKAGEKPSSARVGVIDADGGQTTWMKLQGDPANNYIPRMIWRPDSKALLVQHLNREQNLNRITECSIETGGTKVVYEDKETAWLEVVNDFQYMKDGGSFTWVSEKSGWKSAYVISNGEERRVSPDGLDMISVSLIDEENGWLYYIASPENATQRYLYRTRLNGKGKSQRITPENATGWHTYQISPNGKYARHTYSKAGDPGIIDLVSLPEHEVVKTFVNNDRLKSKIESLDVNSIEFFTVEASDGTSLDCYVMKPIGFDPSKKYPVLFHVYGEPWGQTVTDRWGGSNYLWHALLTQQGYVIMSVDNRGTPGPKGREWRKSVYGQIGVQSSKDQADAAKAIIEKFDYVDEDRIGIWGWSGGGSMTLNMLFRYPEIYKTGISVAPVADQRLYDNIYQERYSGVPQQMPESYEKGSPVNFAKNLEGNLLLIHGTGDDNVHYQNTEVLINELIKHNKVFSLMSYPNRSHGIWEGENTSRHLRETMTKFLKDNLPSGGK